MSAGFESIEKDDILTYNVFTILASVLALYFTALEVLQIYVLRRNYFSFFNSIDVISICLNIYLLQGEFTGYKLI